jgi:ABC-type polysaccharide/polyol phosphate transport system ATPase subunit
MSDPAIVTRGLGKRYRRGAAGFRLRTLKSALLSGNLTADLRPDEAVEALRDVTIEVGEGEAFGVIGGNGSGKSTLLKLVAGLLKPSAGTIEVRGKVAALIELGAGFHPEISGRENIFINGAVLGLSRAQIAERFADIVAFAGLEGFLDEPVKNYSSGMYVRLGFSVAIHTDPDVLLVDEVLAVGDEAFAHRCLRRIEDHLARGRTLLVVSHSLPLVEGLCDRVLWLDEGRPRLVGEPRRVIDAYREEVAVAEGRSHRAAQRTSEDDAEGAEVLRWGSGAARIVAARLRDGSGEERYSLRTGEGAVFELEVECPTALDDFVFGVAVGTRRGVECFGTNTDLAGYAPHRLSGRTTVRLCCESLRLAPGEYVVDVAVHARDGAPYDYRRRAFAFIVSSHERGAGVYLPEHRWEFSGGIEWRPSHESRAYDDEETIP